MTDDPSAAFVTHERTHPTMSALTDSLTSETVRVALVELLTVGQHHHAASHATLNAVGDSRRARGDRVVDEDQRFKALDRSLGAVARALIVALQPPGSDTAALRDALSELAATALGWLDTIPAPRQPDRDTDPR